MYKTTSDNMQKRASTVPVFSGYGKDDHVEPDNDIDKVNKALNEIIKTRRELTEDQVAMEQRIGEIKISLGLPRDFSFAKLNTIHVKFSLQCKEVIEWKSLIGYIKNCREELKKLPVVRHGTMYHYMLRFLKESHPDIYEECRVKGKAMANKDLFVKSPGG